MELGASPLLPPHPPRLPLPALSSPSPPCLQLGGQADLQLLEERGIRLAPMEGGGGLQVVVDGNHDTCDEHHSWSTKLPFQTIVKVGICPPVASFEHQDRLAPFSPWLHLHLPGA